MKENIASEVNSKKGLEKLVKFYAKDPKYLEKAEKDLIDQKQKIQDLINTKTIIENQLAELNAAVPSEGDENFHDEPVEEVVCISVRGLYSYDATNESELSFEENEILIISQQDESGWWFATSQKSGKSGFVPKNYLKF